MKKRHKNQTTDETAADADLRAFAQTVYKNPGMFVALVTVLENLDDLDGPGEIQVVAMETVKDLQELMTQTRVHAFSFRGNHFEVLDGKFYELKCLPGRN